MSSAAPIREGLLRYMVLVLCLGASAGAFPQGASGLPSGSQATPLGREAPAAEPKVVSGETRRAEVNYVGGLLHVTATNSSLNQILREIGRLTGMKITGGVQDDRVFGSYGPGPPSAVLASLLDGTSSNVLIVENDRNGPAELILTPRRGGASPPNPNASTGEDVDREPVQAPQQQSFPQPSQGSFQDRPGTRIAPVGLGGLPPSNGGQTGTPIDGGANLGTTPGAFGGYGQTPPDATAQPNPAGGTGAANGPASSNGVSTPQQIYEQLQKLRQQQTTTTPQ